MVFHTKHFSRVQYKVLHVQNEGDYMKLFILHLFCLAWQVHHNSQILFVPYVFGRIL